MYIDYTPRHISRLTRDTLALVLAGGRGSRLKQLTQWRAKPSVPFGGKFRIVDFVLSNCVNSGIRQIGLVTQYKAHSLLLHVQKGWNFLRGEFGEFVELLPAQQRIEPSWYSGTADAVYQNLDIIRSHGPEFVMILADLTVGCIEVPLEQAKGFGVMSIDSDQRITRFTEKPAHPEPMPGTPDKALASMGIYVFNTRFLYEQLLSDADNPLSGHDFGHDIIPSVIDKYNVYAYPFIDVEGKVQKEAYWRDVGTVDAFWQANQELIGVSPELNLYDDEWPIWTYQEQLPPAKFVFDDEERRGMAVDSMVSGGCIISGACIKHSLLFSHVRVNSYTEISDSVVLPDVVVGQHCRIHKAIIDKGCRIPDGMQIGVNEADDRERFHISDKGVVLVTPEMLGQELHYVR